MAGFLATVPMSVAMGALHRRLPREDRRRLPPRKVMMRLAHALGLRQKMGERQRQVATAAGHFAFGAAGGALYARLCDALALPPTIYGPAFGLAVWAISYLEVLPTLGLLRPATEHPVRYSALMIVSHLLWGGCLGLLVQSLRSARAGPGKAARRLADN
jgi:uncharacterized membrane protein YagU involved in acid resistance